MCICREGRKAGRGGREVGRGKDDWGGECGIECCVGRVVFLKLGDDRAAAIFIHLSVYIDIAPSFL